MECDETCYNLADSDDLMLEFDNDEDVWTTPWNTCDGHDYVHDGISEPPGFTVKGCAKPLSLLPSLAGGEGRVSTRRGLVPTHRGRGDAGYHLS